MLSKLQALTSHGSAYQRGSMMIVVVAIAFISTFLLALAWISTATASAAPAAFDCATVSEIPQSECGVLVTFFTSTNGLSWTTKTNWLETNTPCSWYGITCTFSGRNILRVILNNNQLSGAIPPQLAQLSQLDWLDFSNNQLAGVIPTELAQLTNLHVLRLQNNQLTGSIPKELGDLTSLDQLYLGINPLIGSIPAELGKLVNLTILYLPSAQLTGSIPPELGNMVKLSRLELQGNNLSGPIPTTLGKLSGLVQLLLSNNQLSGEIPPDLGNLKNLTVLYLFNNTLSGPIPPQLGGLTSLDNLQLHNNQLSGEIPPELGNLVNANNFLLYNNALTGKVPSNIMNVGKDWIATHGGTIRIDLSYNALNASDPPVQDFLNLNTQTVPPTTLQVSNVKETSADLSWTTPAYNFDTGGYDIQITRSDGLSELREIATDKKVVTGTVSNLCPGTTYNFALRTHTAPHGAQQNDLRSEFSPPVSTTTLPRTSGLLALYMLALDSDLDKQYDSLLQAIQSATQEDFGKVAVVLVDRKGENNTQILHIECGLVTPIQGLPNPTPGQLDPNLHEYNMADFTTLGAFIKWARQSYNFSTAGYPSTMLSYVGHGVAIAPDTDISQYIKENSTDLVTGAALDENSGFFPSTPSKINMTPDQVTDATSRSLISPYVLAQALNIGTDNGTQPLTLLDIIHCFGGTIEEFYELANPDGNPFAHVITGSPNYAYAGADMLKQALLAIQPNQSAREMAVKVVQAYDIALHQADLSDNNPDVNHPRIMVAVESSKIPTITLHVNQLAAGLLEEFTRTPVNTMKIITATQQASVKFDTTTCQLEGRPQDLRLDAEDGLADLADFATQLKLQLVASSNTLTADATASAVLTTIEQLIASIDAAVITTTYTNGNPWFAKESPPFAFVKDSDTNWSDLFVRFWEERLGQSGEIGTYACSTTLPEIKVMRDRLYLPVIVR